MFKGQDSLRIVNLQQDPANLVIPCNLVWMLVHQIIRL
jgi:hypothetical protein